MQDEGRKGRREGGREVGKQTGPKEEWPEALETQARMHRTAGAQ